MLGAAMIDLETLLDRRRHRFWSSLQVAFKTRNGKQLARSRGRIELVLQYRAVSILIYFSRV
ncbi:hypothetical protein D3C87_2092790 [compost metagenome]